MKNALKWVFTHEPALLAGLVLGVGLFLGLRYGASASATAQASWPTALFTGLGFLSRFTTPAGRASLAAAPGQVGPVSDDAGLLTQFIGQAIHHPQGLLGLFAAHWAQIELALKDAEQRILAVVHPTVTAPAPPSTEAAPVTLTAPEPVSDEEATLKALIGS